MPALRPPVVLLLALASVPFAAHAQTRADLIGMWTWNMAKPACTITRTFRADGTALVVNGEKRSEGKFTFRTSRSGAPVVVYTVDNDGGGRNCDGNSADTTGSRYLFYPDIDRVGMRICLDSAKSSCMGPYLRR